MSLDGRVALVTGGGSGIGAAICRAFSAAGAVVAVLDLDPSAAEAVARDLQRGLAVQADVSDSAAVDAAVARVAAELGQLDVLVNNAGFVGDESRPLVPLMETQLGEAMSGAITTPLRATEGLTDAQWRRMIAVHLDGTFYCTRAALRVMAPRRSGVIINMASICGVEGCAPAPHYSAAKGGILAFTRAVAKDAIVQGIRVNAIAPGYVDTPLLDLFSPMVKGFIAVQTPVGRMGRPEEIAQAAVFLASDTASFFVGETLSPNGGYVTV